jgi:DNA repair protein RadC
MSGTNHTLFEAALPGFEPAELPGNDTRNSLRERFVNVGADAVADEEMLELILHRAVAQPEVKSLARRLIGIFGDFNRVLSASPTRLKNVLGVNENVIVELKIVEAAAHRMAKSAVIHREVLSCWKSLLTYCQTRMAHLETEQFRTLYLDRKNILIADEVAQNGTVDHVPVYPREIIKRALELNACALILVHNHPSGDTSPSDEDISMTETIKIGADVMGITIHDHLIIGKSEPFSFQSHGLL